MHSEGRQMDKWNDGKFLNLFKFNLHNPIAARLIRLLMLEIVHNAAYNGDDMFVECAADVTRW